MVEDKTQLGSKSQLYIFTDSNREEINQYDLFEDCYYNLNSAKIKVNKYLRKRFSLDSHSKVVRISGLPKENNKIIPNKASLWEVSMFRKLECPGDCSVEIIYPPNLLPTEYFAEESKLYPRRYDM
ncbi:unnamed protein product [Candida parapsilosis]